MREEDAKMASENAMTKAERSIWVTFNKEGVHMYPGADTDPKLATGDWDDVSFLGIPHRHIFHFRVRIQVFHNDVGKRSIIISADIGSPPTPGTPQGPSGASGGAGGLGAARER